MTSNFANRLGSPKTKELPSEEGGPNKYVRRTQL